MPQLRTLSSAIADRLDSIDGLKGCVVPYRRKSIAAKFQELVGKTNGRCVVVRVLRASNTSDKRIASLYAVSVTVTLFTLPVITRAEEQNSDDLLASIDEALHGWWPMESIPSQPTSFLIAGDISYPEDTPYDASKIVFTTPPISLREKAGFTPPTSTTEPK